MKKFVLITVTVILILAIAALLSLGQIIKTGINKAGPQLAGVPVHVSEVHINPLTGSVRVSGLFVGNPEGFKTVSAMELNDLTLKINMASLFSETIVIEKIHIDAPQITYERGLTASNLSALQSNLPAAQEPAAPSEQKTGPAKKVMIEDFLLNDAKVHVSLTALGGQKMTLAMTPIHLQNIGKENDGASLTEVISIVLRSITGAVTDLIAASGNLTGDALKGSADLLNSTGDSTINATKGAVEGGKKGLNGLLGK